MNFRFSPEEEAFRKEVREFLDKEVTEEVRNETYSRGSGPRSLEVHHKIGAKGWYIMGWPKEYGGQEISGMHEFILAEEILAHFGPDVWAGKGIVAPILMEHGTEEQKREFIPKIARGEVEYALGYTEPQAGTDLANIQMTAVEDGDDYIINGQKVFNTYAHFADYHWLLARTDPNAVPKYRGFSLFIVDLKSPGITIRQQWPMGGQRTNEVFYDNVRVPKKNLVGEKNRGWYYLVGKAIARERAIINAPGRFRPSFDKLVRYCKETNHDGKKLTDDPVVRQKLAQLAIEIEVIKLLVYRVLHRAHKGEDISYEADVVKIFGGELELRLAEVGMEILGPYGQLSAELTRGYWGLHADLSAPTTKKAPVEGRFEARRRQTVARFGAGSPEILRTMVAVRGLGLPRQ